MVMVENCVEEKRKTILKLQRKTKSLLDNQSKRLQGKNLFPSFFLGIASTLHSKRCLCYLFLVIECHLKSVGFFFWLAEFLSSVIVPWILNVIHMRRFFPLLFCQWLPLLPSSLSINHGRSNLCMFEPKLSCKLFYQNPHCTNRLRILWLPSQFIVRLAPLRCIIVDWILKPL